MNAVTYTHARKNLATMMDQVSDDHSPVIITRKGERAVVMISLEDYESLEETGHLLRSPENARRLMRSVKQLEGGEGVERKLVS